MPSSRTSGSSGTSSRRRCLPRNGLTVGEMTEAQRKLAHALLQSGLSQRGYMTATAIMELETILGALESAARRQPAGRGGDVAGARPGPLLLLRVRHAVSARRVGMARGGPSRLAELHRRQRQLRRRVAVVLRDATRPKCAKGRRRALRILATQEDSARALLMALDDGAAQAGGDRRRRAERHLDDERGRDQAAGAWRHRRRRAERRHSARC